MLQYLLLCNIIDIYIYVYICYTVFVVKNKSNTKGYTIMILTTIGLALATSATMKMATPLQPYSITRTSANDVTLYVSRKTVVHLSKTSGLEVIADNNGKVVKAIDGANTIDIPVHKGERLNIDAQTGFNSSSYKIGNVSIKVPAIKN